MNNTGSMGQMEEALQRAADTVERIGFACGFRCSSTKSELLVFRKRGNQILLYIQLHQSPVKEVDTIRVLGAYISNQGKNSAAIQNLRTPCTNISRMMSRIANRHHGIKEADILRLVHAFVISRVTYSFPYTCAFSKRTNSNWTVYSAFHIGKPSLYHHGS
ncbi:hypothetical protein HPB49_018611 [Dermacentor silvarum]|uniref:Uncharacterized protein n=1 Tax=Dermacentor silvarum TaxID=543639 RepID=A0ACB8DKX1_DERSI|nr:hypothetical protein HPB49_018611 [Dermacentor silvarum]